MANVITKKSDLMLTKLVRSKIRIPNHEVMGPGIIGTKLPINPKKQKNKAIKTKKTSITYFNKFCKLTYNVYSKISAYFFVNP